MHIHGTVKPFILRGFTVQYIIYMALLNFDLEGFHAINVIYSPEDYIIGAIYVIVIPPDMGGTRCMVECPHVRWYNYFVFHSLPSGPIAPPY